MAIRTINQFDFFYFNLSGDGQRGEFKVDLTYQDTNGAVQSFTYLNTWDGECEIKARDGTTGAVVFDLLIPPHSPSTVVAATGWNVRVNKQTGEVDYGNYIVSYGPSPLN